jgi:hypothetical protein
VQGGAARHRRRFRHRGSDQNAFTNLRNQHSPKHGGAARSGVQSAHLHGTAQSAASPGSVEQAGRRG